MLLYREQALPTLLSILCTLLNTVAADEPLIPALLGISLGSTHITAATINGSGTFPLALLEGSQGYIDFMKNTTDPELHLDDYYDEAFNVMKQVLEDIRVRGSHINDKDMRIGGIIAPAHFTYEMRLLVFWGWNAVDNGARPESVRPVSYSAIVYSENDCTDRLYNPTLPGDQVSLSMVTTYLYETTSHIIAMPTSPGEIIDFLRSANDYEDHPNITSIVLSSHDGNAEFEAVREALDKVDVRLWNKRKISPLEIKYMAAASAACIARQRAVFPLEDGDCGYRHPDHDETVSPFLHVEL